MGLVDRLEAVLGGDHVLTDVELARPYGTDWTGRWSVTPAAVVRPSSTEHVSKVLRICADEGVPVVPQGGNTSLVGGSVPSAPGSVVLSTSRLVDIEPAEPHHVTVGAGVTVAAVQAAANRQGLSYGVDLASRDSATIGGTVATNAGGIRVVHFGDTGRQVAGVEAVFADGSVMSRLSGLPKDSAGYDLSGLLVGSEGTLAVVTRVRLRLWPALPDDRVTALVGVGSLSEALELASAVPPGDLLAAEYFDTTGMQLVCDVASLPHPLRDRWPFYLLLETRGEPPLPAAVDAAVDRRLWSYRERQPEAAASLGQVHGLDVALPWEQLDSFVQQLPALVSPHRVLTFGHLAEGNLHVQVIGPSEVDGAVTDAVLESVADRGGSVSSEHGVGRAKARHLHLCRDLAQRRAMARIKQALDPTGLLNPGVLLEASPGGGTGSAP